MSAHVESASPARLGELAAANCQRCPFYLIDPNCSWSPHAAVADAVVISSQWVAKLYVCVVETAGLGTKKHTEAPLESASLGRLTGRRNAEADCGSDQAARRSYR